LRRRSVLVSLLAWPALARGAASPLRLDRVLGAADDAAFARADGPRSFTFPADHGPHPAFRSEWWYLTANLYSADGAEYGLQFTLFRQALRAQPATGGPWDASQIYLGHLALTDVAAGRHRHAERLARAHPAMARVMAEPFEAWIDGWRLAAEGDDLTGLTLAAAADDFAVRMRFEPAKPLILQGDAGWSRKGPAQASYYYSMPRLAASGELRLGARATTVAGAAWLDREWSTSVLSDGQSGWDWFALHLDSGEEIMVFQLRRRDGLRDPFDHGVWVGRDGTAQHLAAAAFRLAPQRLWRDDAGVSWPVAWEIEIDLPGGTRRWRVEAALDDQRMDTLITYWEGLVRVFDPTGTRAGAGYMELTGYD
jgi:predicted secreted hydrolase